MKFKVGDRIKIKSNAVLHYGDHKMAKKQNYIGVIYSVKNDDYDVNWYKKGVSVLSSCLVTDEMLEFERTTINPNFKNYTKEEAKI